MSRLPHVSPATASTVLALVDAARAHAPDAPLAWLAGYACRAAGERVQPAEDDRPSAKIALAQTEQALRQSLPPGGWGESS